MALQATRPATREVPGHGPIHVVPTSSVALRLEDGLPLVPRPTNARTIVVVRIAPLGAIAPLRIPPALVAVVLPAAGLGRRMAKPAVALRLGATAPTGARAPAAPERVASSARALADFL